MIKILCILQNAWGDRELPIIFSPNPYNHSARVIRKIVGKEKHFWFANTTNVVTKTAAEKAKPDFKHFDKVIRSIYTFDLVLVCGVQAKQTVEQFSERIANTKVPILFIPHPASRSLSNVRCEEISKQINEIIYGKKGNRV